MVDECASSVDATRAITMSPDFYMQTKPNTGGPVCHGFRMGLFDEQDCRFVVLIAKPSNTEQVSDFELWSSGVLPANTPEFLSLSGDPIISS